jgi:DNA-binding transcriptional ArsR family regulator
MSKELFVLHAQICKMLAHPKRLEILTILGDTEMAAGDLSRKMNIPKANASQHLALMRNAGILETRREGVNIYYRISSVKVIQACELMREVLLENHGRRGRALRTVRR